MKRTTPTARLFTRCLGATAVAALAFSACSSDDSSSTSTLPLAPRLVVTSVKGDVESQLMAAIYARVLEDAGFRVGRKDPVELDRAGYYQAIQDGEFQLIPEYSGDLLRFVYDQPGAGEPPATSLPSGPATTQAPIIVTTTTAAPTTTVAVETTTADTTAATTDTATDTATTTTASSSGLLTRTVPTSTSTAGTTTETTPETTGDTGTVDTSLDVTTTTETTPGNGHSITEQVLAINAAMPSTLIVNNGSSAENKVVIACTATAMTDNAGTQLISYTDLASIAPNIRIGGSAEFLTDPDAGFPKFLQYYGGDFKDTVVVDDAGLADAISDNTAECFAMNSLNPLIGTAGMTILVDDKVMIPSNAVIALLSSTATPEAIGALDAIAANLTTERLNQMLNEINANGTNPVTVANAFVDTL